MNKKIVEKNEKHTMIIRIVVILINMMLFYRVFNVMYFVEFYIIGFLFVAINAYYYLYETLGKTNKVYKKDYQEIITQTINDMPCAEALNEKIFTTKMEEDLEVESVKESLDEDADIKETVEILRPNEIISKNPVFDKHIDAKKYFADLVQYFKDCGLNVETNNIREIFASMAASKLILFTNKNQEISERFIEIFTEYLGINRFNDYITDDVNTYEDLFSYDHQFVDCFQSANFQKNRINVMVIKQVDLLRIDDYLDKVINYAKDPLLPLEHEGKFDYEKQIPSNIWFMVIPKSFKQSYLTERLLESAVTIELNIIPIKPKLKVEENPYKLSYEHMTNLLTDGYEQYFIDEDDWKKIDEIEYFLNQVVPFKLDNRLFRQLERYASTYLLFTGDYKEMLDSMLFAKLLPLIYTIEAFNNEKSIEAFLLLLEDLFGLEYLIKSKKMLKAIQIAH